MGCFALLCFEMIFRCFTFVWCYAYRESLGNNACLECVFVLNEMWSFVHWTYIDLEPFKYLFFLFNNISKGNTFKLVPWNIEVPFTCATLQIHVHRHSFKGSTASVFIVSYSSAMRRFSGSNCYIAHFVSSVLQFRWEMCNLIAYVCHLYVY